MPSQTSANAPTRNKAIPDAADTEGGAKAARINTIIRSRIFSAAMSTISDSTKITTTLITAMNEQQQITYRCHAHGVDVKAGDFVWSPEALAYFIQSSSSKVAKYWSTSISILLPTPLSSAILDMTFRAFVCDLSDDGLSEQVAREMASIDHFLRTILITINMKIVDGGITSDEFTILFSSKWSKHCLIKVGVYLSFAVIYSQQLRLYRSFLTIFPFWHLAHVKFKRCLTS